MTYTMVPEPVSGWEITKFVRNPPGGLHAIAFISTGTTHSSELVAIAFRGTDLNTSTPSGLADACANQMLAGVPYAELSTACRDAFSEEELDYPARAADFAVEVQQAFPKRLLLFTGHSLGGELASLLAVRSLCPRFPTPTCTLRGPAIAFSAPGIGHENHTIASEKCVVNIANEFDPIVTHTEQKQIGKLCLLSPGEEPQSCAECKTTAPIRSPPCLKCFFATHYFKTVLDLLQPAGILCMKTTTVGTSVWVAAATSSLLATALIVITLARLR
mmetsp:Transcript_6863/g.16839  ORF Transcript_6863/g.16839 Transcript_6863/m.16839 type:complete len:274 (-) Transcript_6863:34-855(-)